MKNILKNRTILGIASILLSLIICFGLTPLFNNAIGAKTNVVRVSENITKGELITAKKIQTVEVGGFNMPNEVLKNTDNIIGKYAKADFYKGDYVLNSKISELPLTNYDYLNEFNGTERAISVSIKSFAAGLSGKLEPGDIVSILVSDFGELKETVSPVELQYVQVLAVTAGTGLDTDEYEKNNEAIEEDKELPSTLTLKVSADQAELLAELETKGKIHAVFVYRGSKENTVKFLEEQANILLLNQEPLNEEEKVENIDSATVNTEVNSTNLEEADKHAEE